MCSGRLSVQKLQKPGGSANIDGFVVFVTHFGSHRGADFCCTPLPTVGPNCFAGNRVIPAGERVAVDEQTTCYCTYRDGTWHTHPQATCEQRPAPSPVTEAPAETEIKPSGKRPFVPRLDAIP